MNDLSRIDHLTTDPAGDPSSRRPQVDAGGPGGPVLEPVGHDEDPGETAEWLAALASVLDGAGPERARFLMGAMPRGPVWAGRRR